MKQITEAARVGHNYRQGDLIVRSPSDYYLLRNLTSHFTVSDDESLEAAGGTWPERPTQTKEFLSRIIDMAFRSFRLLSVRMSNAGLHRNDSIYISSNVLRHLLGPSVYRSFFVFSNAVT